MSSISISPLKKHVRVMSLVAILAIVVVAPRETRAQSVHSRHHVVRDSGARQTILDASDSSKHTCVSIFDANGNRVDARCDLHGGRASLDTTDLPAGTYEVIVKTGAKQKMQTIRVYGHGAAWMSDHPPNGAVK